MADAEANVSGTWSGLYSYPDPRMPESHFVCVLTDRGGLLSGTVHEMMNHYRGPPTEERAELDGVREGRAIRFLKMYTGHGSQAHDVAYDGVLNEERDEIEGWWTIHGAGAPFTGRFLMIRKESPKVARAVEKMEVIR